jgi:hypothetical protein
MKTSRSFGKTGPTIQERLVASYPYTIGDRAHAGNRLDFSFGSDNFGTSRRREQLAVLRSANVTVYVDPADPGQSVLDRRLPGEQVVFALIFLLFPCCIGTLAAIGLISSGLSKLECSAAERYAIPAAGLVHGLPALYPILFEPGRLGRAGCLCRTIRAQYPVHREADQGPVPGKPHMAGPLQEARPTGSPDPGVLTRELPHV